MRIALLGNVFQTKKNAYIKRVLKKLAELQADICIEEGFADFLNRELCVSLNGMDTFKMPHLKADLVISMGGDGTFLTSAAQVGARGIPILGINTGRLGFLADVSPEDIENALDAVFDGRYTIEQRAVIAMTLDGETYHGYPYALNEVAILKHDNSSLIEIDTHINGALLTNYMSDGLIISTPTGSTGYSLSVGGPIIVPRSGTFCLSPVASHSLSTRPVIVCDDVVITLRVRSRSHNFLIAIDGRSETCREGSRLTIRKADYKINVVKRNSHIFFNTLRNKMMWGADGRG